MTKRQPIAGERRWEVEWCVYEYVDPETGDGNPDQDKEAYRVFKDREEAFAFAKVALQECPKPFVMITEMEFTMEDADLYPRGHWVYVDEGECYEGE